jgi:hypothetical protein
MTIKFKTNAAFENSWLQGEVKITYAELVEIFGRENNTGDDYKVQAEWSIKFADGIYATIYDWKEGKNYCGDDGISKEQVTNWHIGGTTKASVTHVMEIINYHRDEAKSKPAAKEFTVDMREFRNTLVEAQNVAIDMMQAIETVDGQVPREKLIEFTVRAAEASVMTKLIKSLDAARI